MDAKHLSKIQQCFIIRPFNNLEIAGDFLNLIKVIYEKPIVNITLQLTVGKCEKQNAFPLSSKRRQECLLLSLS